MTKDKIINSIYKGWLKENPGLKEDIEELAHRIAFFNTKWGTKINPEDILEKPKK